MAPPAYAEKYKTIQVELRSDGACIATMNSGDKGGVNLITGKLFKEFGDLVRNVARDDLVRVLVVRSANEHFWLAHLDVNSILNEVNPPEDRGEILNEWHSNMEVLRNMPKATIAVLTGRVGGGGHEFALNFDMRFGIYGATKICQMEVPLGIIPGGGACVNLRRVLGAARAMEVVLSGDDIDAEQAERWGLLNRCFQDKQQLEVKSVNSPHFPGCAAGAALPLALRGRPLRQGGAAGGGADAAHGGLEGELDALLQIPQGPRSPSSHAEVSAGRWPDLQRRDGLAKDVEQALS